MGQFCSSAIAKIQSHQHFYDFYKKEVPPHLKKWNDAAEQSWTEDQWNEWGDAAVGSCDKLMKVWMVGQKFKDFGIDQYMNQVDKAVNEWNKDDSTWSNEKYEEWGFAFFEAMTNAEKIVVFMQYIYTELSPVAAKYRDGGDKWGADKLEEWGYPAEEKLEAFDTLYAAAGNPPEDGEGNNVKKLREAVQFWQAGGSWAEEDWKKYAKPVFEAIDGLEKKYKIGGAVPK